MSWSYRDMSRWATIRILARRIDTVSIYRHIVSSLVILVGVRKDRTRNPWVGTARQSSVLPLSQIPSLTDTEAGEIHLIYYCLG